LVACSQPQAVLDKELWHAIVSADSAGVATSLAHGANPNVTSTDGVTALMLAASTGNAGTTTALLSKGAHVDNVTPKHRLSALMFAANACSPAVVEVLLSGHADAKLKDTDHGSAADWAFRGCKDPKESARLMERLYGSGASIQPRGDVLGLILAEVMPPPIDSLLASARSQFPR
jgi:hypothetical protein